MLSVLSGLAGGAIHAVAGPDHVAAVAPLAVGNRRAGFIAGLDWGLGHGAGVAAMGALAVLAKDWLPIDSVSSWSEFGVGFLLIAVGIWAGVRGYRLLKAGSEQATPEKNATRKRSASFGMGAVHGSAGAGHLLAVLPAAGLTTPAAIGYLVAYVLGAAGTMSLIGGLTGELSARGSWKTRPIILLVAATLAVLVGAVWLVRSWPG